MEKPVNVKILDQNYLIKSDQDEQQVQRVAEYLDNKFREIKSCTTGLSETKIAILVAFHTAAEYFQALNDKKDVHRDIQSRAKRLNMQLDGVKKG